MMNAADAETLFGQMLDGARAMRARMIPVTAPANAIDVCGTGGDGSHSLNVSTAVAIVVAACGVPVAKHGNRAASSKAGAADTLEALGLDLDRASQTAEATLADLGICFLFAQKHHPALARIAPIRKSLGRRTIFNLLGPLANPARVTKQLIGVAQPGFVVRYADAMALLGYERAMVVSGWDVEDPAGGTIDELSVAGGQATKMIGIAPTDGSLAPNRAVYDYYPISALKGGDASFNAGALKRMLLGEKGAYREAVQLNAAGALLVAGEVDSWREGFEDATEAIDKGLAKALLDCWIAYK
jgi:anthranilate phosphoribosyltransferase